VVFQSSQDEPYKPNELKPFHRQPTPPPPGHLRILPAQPDPQVQQDETQGDQDEAIGCIGRSRPPARADGLPWDLWLVSVDGVRFQQLTNVGFDSPWPAWSRDGKYIAIFETSGFYVLDVNQRLISQWRPEGGHGVMDWWMPK
jgi:hypothetical protein